MLFDFEKCQILPYNRFGMLFKELLIKLNVYFKFHAESNYLCYYKINMEVANSVKTIRKCECDQGYKQKDKNKVR